MLILTLEIAWQYSMAIFYENCMVVFDVNIEYWKLPGNIQYSICHGNIHVKIDIENCKAIFNGNTPWKLHGNFHVNIEYWKLHGNIQCSILHVQYSIYDVQCSVSNIQYSMFNSQCLMFNVQCSVSNIQSSMFNVQYSMLNSQCSIFNVQQVSNILIT